MQSQSDTQQGVGEEVRNDAKSIASTATNRLHSEVDARKGEAVTQVKSVSSAIDNAAGNLDDNAPAWLKSAFQQGAQQAQKFADAIEQKDSRQLVADVSDFARNSPGTFLAACAAAGFAASRLFKAGGDTPAVGQQQPSFDRGVGSSPASTFESSDSNFASPQPGYRSSGSAFGSSEGDFGSSELGIGRPQGQV